MNKENELFKMRLKKLHLKNFKTFDNFEIEFPEPSQKENPDVFIMGSRDSFGKTSVLEAISLLFVNFIFYNEYVIDKYNYTAEVPINVMEYFVKSGQQKAEVEGHFEINDTVQTCKININLDKQRITFSGIEKFQQYFYQNEYYRHHKDISFRFLSSLLSIDDEPLIVPPFMYFHSYRKIKRGVLELKNKSEFEQWAVINKSCPFNIALSKFKLEIARIMMSKAGEFRNIGHDFFEKEYIILNNLMKEYTNATIDELCSLSDHKYMLKIKPLGNEPSFPFDALGADQKEIISTLYLTWKYTQKQPGIILIDEPELHLNTKCQMNFINSLYKLAPQNQYIFATHSENVLSSVDSRYRIQLQPETVKTA